MWALTSLYCQFWHLGCWQDVLVIFQQNSAWWIWTDTAVCRSLWSSLLRLLQSSWPFCRDRTPQSDVGRTYTHVSVRLGDPFDTTENAFFRAFRTLRSQLHLHHRSQRALTEIMSKITPNLGQNTRGHAATAVISLAHSAVTYWSCFAIHKHLRHVKNMKLLLRHGIYTCIYCVKIFSRWNIPKRRSEAKIGQNQCSGAL